MKKLVLSLVALCLISVVAVAHPGRTDSTGGHYDKSTGEYHYHHGYPAHQHTSGTCPYDFTDKTDHSYRQSDGEGSQKPSITNETNHVRDISLFEKIGIPAFIAFLSGPMIWSVFVTIILAIFKLSNKSKLIYSILSETMEIGIRLAVIPAFLTAYWFLWKSRFVLIPIIAWILLIIYTICKTRKRYESAKAGCEKYKMYFNQDGTINACGALDGTRIGTDGLPAIDDWFGYWGKPYTFFVSNTGGCFHSKFRCSSANTIVHALNVGKKKPCSRCCPKLPDLNWYKEFRKMKLIAEKYEIKP